MIHNRENTIRQHDDFRKHSLPPSPTSSRGASFSGDNLIPDNKGTIKAISSYKQEMENFKKQFFNSKEATPYIISLIREYTSFKNHDISDNFTNLSGQDLKELQEALERISDPSFKTPPLLESSDIKILRHHANEFFYSNIMGRIKKTFENLNKTNTEKEKLEALSNILNSYNFVAQKRNDIIKPYERIIKNIILRHIKKHNLNKSLEDLYPSVFLEVVELINSYDHEKNSSFSTYLYNRIPFVIIDIYRNKNQGIRNLDNDKGSVLSPTPFSQLGNPNINYYNRINDEHDPTADNTAKLAYKFLNYTYGKERYIIESSCEIYREDKYQYLVADFEPSAHFHRRKVLGKLQLISVAIDYFITQDEIKDIKNEIKNGLLRVEKRVAKIESKLIPELISKHFGLDGDLDGNKDGDLDGDKEQSRFELCDTYGLKIESIDSCILKSLEIIFKKDPKMFNKALKLSLTIEDNYREKNRYPTLHNLYSILTKEEISFAKCRYDFKNRIVRNLHDIANNLQIDIKKLIEIERRVIEKLEKYEPEIFLKLCEIFKANIKDRTIRKALLTNALFMLSSLQFEIINLRHGITTSEKLSKEDIIKKLSIDAQTYDKEYKKAVSTLRELKVALTHLDLKFLKALEAKIKKPRDKKIFKLKFIKHLTPKQIAKKLNMPLEKYLLVERKLFANNVFTKKEKSKLFYLYRKDFLEKENLTYKEVLENSVFVLPSKEHLIITIYAFGLFNKKIRSSTKLAYMLSLPNKSTVGKIRRYSVKKLENLLNINYLNELCYREIKERKIALSLDAYYELKQELLKAIEDFSPAQKENFYRSFRLGKIRNEKNENYDENNKNSLQNKKLIYDTLELVFKLYETFPRNPLNKFLIMCSNDFISNDTLKTKSKEVFPILNNTKQKLIIYYLGLFGNKIKSDREIRKETKISRYVLNRYKKEIFHILNKMFKRIIPKGNIEMLIWEQKPQRQE
ncbi:MAG: sigma factor [Bdellovibrionota bacterium]